MCVSSSATYSTKAICGKVNQLSISAEYACLLYFCPHISKNMKRYIICLALLALITLPFLSEAQSLAQPPAAQNPQGSRWVFGGDFGLGFSSYGSNILISPQVGYLVTPRWEVGTRLTYNHYSYKNYSFKFSTNNYGGGLYTSYMIFKGLFAHAENELLSYQRLKYGAVSGDDKERAFIHSIFVGGGYRQYLGANSYASITILYNLNETFDTPYDNPIFRIGFGFGL